MRRSSIGSAGSSFPHSIRENSPSNVSQSSDNLPTDEPPPAYAPPPIDDFEAGRQSRDGSVGQDALSVGDTEGSPPPAYTFPPTDDWGLDEVDTFKTEC